jgi:aldehyde:ferredoxin oxidoreductase
MNVKGGYFFRIMEVDLASGASEVRSFDDDFALQYIGGRGFGARILADHLKKKKKIDPLGPDNILGLSRVSTSLLQARTPSSPSHRPRVSTGIPVSAAYSVLSFVRPDTTLLS